MSIFNDVKDLAGGQPKSRDWYRSQLLYGLQDYDGGFKTGDIIFFSYSPQTPSPPLPWYDQYPMVQVIERDNKKGQFTGGNLHYLRPNFRRSVGKAWATGGYQYPMQCHHKYFMSSVANPKVIPRDEFVNWNPLPLEKFWIKRGGMWMDIPSSHIWSRV